MKTIKAAHNQCMINLHENAILDQERASAVAELQAIVDGAIASGISYQTFDDIIEESRAEMDARQSADGSKTTRA